MTRASWPQLSVKPKAGRVHAIPGKARCLSHHPAPTHPSSQQLLPLHEQRLNVLPGNYPDDPCKCPAAGYIVGKLSLREVESLAQGHTAGSGRARIRLLGAEAWLLTFTHRIIHPGACSCCALGLSVYILCLGQHGATSSPPRSLPFLPPKQLPPACPSWTACHSVPLISGHTCRGGGPVSAPRQPGSPPPLPHHLPKLSVCFSSFSTHQLDDPEPMGVCIGHTQAFP